MAQGNSNGIFLFLHSTYILFRHRPDSYNLVKLYIIIQNTGQNKFIIQISVDTILHSPYMFRKISVPLFKKCFRV